MHLGSWQPYLSNPRSLNMYSKFLLPQLHKKHSCSQPLHYRSQIRRPTSTQAPTHIYTQLVHMWAHALSIKCAQRSVLLYSVPFSILHPRKSPSGNDPICQPKEPGYSQAYGLDEDNLYHPREVYLDVTDTCACHNINNAAVSHVTGQRGEGGRGEGASGSQSRLGVPWCLML